MTYLYMIPFIFTIVYQFFSIFFCVNIFIRTFNIFSFHSFPNMVCCVLRQCMFFVPGQGNLWTGICWSRAVTSTFTGMSVASQTRSSLCQCWQMWDDPNFHHRTLGARFRPHNRRFLTTARCTTSMTVPMSKFSSGSLTSLQVVVVQLPLLPLKVRSTAWYRQRASQWRIRREKVLFLFDNASGFHVGIS